MKSIKFRVWDDIKKRYYYPEDEEEIFLNQHGELVIEFAGELFAEMNSLSLIAEQSTRLIDKNGTEIYEGDIVKEDGVQNNETIEWSESGARYKIACSDLYEDYAEYHIEVIGNIHGNPELLVNMERK